MIGNILHADAVLNVRSYADFLDRYQATLQALRDRGIVPVATVNSQPVAVRVDHGRWIFDCVCGSGVAAHPGWPDARCLGCGAIYTAVRFPVDKAAIETALLRRPFTDARNWRPGETVDAAPVSPIVIGVPFLDVLLQGKVL